MFLRSFLLAILVAAFIGTTSACLTQSQIETMFKKYTPDGKKKWSKAKNAKTCDAAMVYSMKNLMKPFGSDNVGAYVQLVQESVEALEKNGGKIDKAYEWYTKKCRAELTKAEKTLGYPTLAKSGFNKCVKKNRSMDDYSGTIKMILKSTRSALKDTDVLPSLLMSLMKVPELQPMMSIATSALCPAETN